MAKSKLFKILMCLFLVMFFVFVIISLIGSRTDPGKIVITTGNDTVVDIDGKDGSYLSAWSSAEIHLNEEGNVEWIYIPLDAVLAFDIPDRFGERMYCLSSDDIVELKKILDSIKTEENEQMIEAILDIIEEEWYSYTPT